MQPATAGCIEGGEMTNNRRQVVLVAVLITLPLAAAACSSSSASSASPKDAASGRSTNAPLGQPTPAAAGNDGGNNGGKLPAACSLISQDQAKTALGDDVAPGVEQQTAAGNGSSCTFDGAGEADDVIIQVGPTDFIRHIQGTHQTQPIPGPADEALVYGLGAGIYDIYAGKGSTGIDISISKGGKGSDPEALPPQPVADALTTLAKTALSKI
jgi:hypothetical protein